ncbi:hypothetical protein B0H14DRAFT_2584136 [Mycena olivaceomarginata]|nr:hypothetical protein B0H14DRAFT_2584136 [Mycena olivaceomarginata]
MVGWVQPSNTTKRAVSVTLVAVAIIATLMRLGTRIHTRRFWLDDAWVILVLCFSGTMIASIWLRSDPSQSSSAMIAAYWIGTLGFTNTLWLIHHSILGTHQHHKASRMSVMFSIIRLIPYQFQRLRKITTGFAAVFALCWMGLLIQKVHLCASDKSWYKGHHPQQCPLSTGVVASQLISD